MSTEIDMHALAVEIAELIGEPTPPLLDAEQAGELLHVPPSWVLTQARAGRIPNVRLGHYVRFDRNELLAWLDRRQTGPRANGERSS